jgi:hypothetical protein
LIFAQNSTGSMVELKSAFADIAGLDMRDGRCRLSVDETKSSSENRAAQCGTGSKRGEIILTNYMMRLVDD